MIFVDSDIVIEQFKKEFIDYMQVKKLDWKDLSSLEQLTFMFLSETELSSSLRSIE